MNNSECGFSLLDVLVATLLSAILALGISKSAMLSFNAAHKAHINGLATQIALETLENYSGTDPQDLSTANDITGEVVVRSGVTFTKDVDIEITSDRALTVAVTIKSSKANIPTTVKMSTAYALWGER